MQIVIEIPEEYYKAIMEIPVNQSTVDMLIIKNGTPLPKGHGRLGDLDELEKEMDNGIKAGLFLDGYENYPHINNMDDCVDCVRYADAIIEADKVESEGKE